MSLNPKISLGATLTVLVIAALFAVRKPQPTPPSHREITNRAIALGTTIVLAEFDALQTDTQSNPALSQSVLSLRAQYQQANQSASVLQQFQPVLSASHAQITGSFPEPQRTEIHVDFLRLESSVADQLNAQQIKEALDRNPIFP